MKQTLSLILNAVLLVAVIVLFYLQFHSKGATEEQKALKIEESDSKIQGGAEASIAYINVDSLLLKYGFAKEANERLLSKSEKSQAELAKQMNQWQKDGAEFQRKLQTNSFLSRERAEQENTRLMKRRQELEQLDSRMTQALMQEQKRMNEQLKDTINTFLKEYNKKKHYKIILSNTMNDNVLYAEKKYDITKEVVEMLNERYKKEE
jgi:outer membrane protein